MPKSIEDIKLHLAEFAEILSLFNSEAVQVVVAEKLLNIFFDVTNSTGENPLTSPAKAKSRGALRSKKSPAGEFQSDSRTLSATHILNTLLDNGYFRERRQMSDIIRHSWNSLESDVRATELSGILLRYVKEGKLDRHKRVDNDRFEYFNPSASAARQ